MNKNVLFFAFLLLLMFIPVSFASDDGGVLTSDVNASATADVLSVQSDEILSGDGDVVYFDANAEEDESSDGSYEHPFKYLTDIRVSGKTAILGEGEYEFLSESSYINLANVNLIGSGSANTVITSYNLPILFTFDYSSFDSNIFLSGLTLNAEIQAMSAVVGSDDVVFVNMPMFNGGEYYFENTQFLNGIYSTSYYDEDYDGIPDYELPLYFGFDYCIFKDNPYGAIISEGGSVTLTISNSTFENNYGEYGGAIYCNGGSLTIDNSTFKDNPNGAIVMDGESASLTISNSTFENNSANCGGAVNVNGGILVIDNCTFLNNTAVNHGGAVSCDNSDVTITNSRFEDNYALDDVGGAICVIGSNLTFTGSNITGSVASFGSAVTSLSSNSSISRSRFEKNSALWYGGAVYSMFGEIVIMDSSFIENSAVCGGSLFIDSMSLCQVESLFRDSYALLYGGAIYSFRSNNIFTNVYETDSDDVFETDEFNLTVYDSGDYPVYVYRPSELTSLPSSYNLADYGFVTGVKNQLVGGNCWSFAALAALESCILKAGGEAFDFSEENMKNVPVFYSDYGLNVFKPNGGGNQYLALSYLTSWLGPVNDEDDLYGDQSILSPVLKSLYHVQNVITLSDDGDEIKWAILNYGAVATTMYYDDEKYYNQDTFGYYYNETFDWDYGEYGHAVTIVGWDDNYDKNNFLIEPSRNGAWIIKNSWGDDWGNDGYFYVSYDDTHFAQMSTYTFILNDTVKYDKNYQYDLGDWLDYNSGADEATYTNIFTVDGDEYLAAVSTYFIDKCDFIVEISVNGALKVTKEGHMDRTGYFTIPLGKYIYLNGGDNLSVSFTIKNSENDWVYIPTSPVEYYNNNVVKAGISYVKTAGGEVFDLFEVNHGVASIRAFTIVNPIKTYINLTVEDSRIIASVADQYGNILNEGNVTFNVNGESVNVSVSDFRAVRDYDFSVYDLYNITVSWALGAYESCTNNTVFETGWDVTSNVEDVSYGSCPVVNVTLGEGKSFNNNVTIRIGDYSYSANITFDSYLFTVPDILKACDVWNVSLEYVTANGYHKFANTTFKINKISPDLEVNVSDVDYGESIWVESNIDGDYSYSFDLNNGDFTIQSGSGYIDVIVDVDEYNVLITFKGNENYTEKTLSRSFKVSPAKSSVVVPDIGDITYGDLCVVTIGEYENASSVVGELYRDGVPVSGVTYEGFTITVNGSLDVGTYTLKVTAKAVDGNHKDSDSVEKEFSIVQSESSIVIDDIVAVTYPGDVVVTYTTNSTVKGVVVYVKGTATEKGTIVRGDGKVTVSGLGAGTYVINVTVGDANHKDKSTIGEFTVDKSTASATFDGAVVVYGNHFLTMNGTVVKQGSGVEYNGNVSVTIGTQSYIGSVVDGKLFVDVDMSVFAAGSYKVTVEGSNQNYTVNKLELTNNVTVNRAGSDLTISPTSTNVQYQGNNVVISVGGFVNTTGSNFTAVIPGYNVVTVSGNSVIVNIKALNAGTYRLRVSSVVDANHTAVTKSATITITKVHSTLNSIGPISLVYGESGNVTVVSGGAQGVTAELYMGETLIADAVSVDANVINISAGLNAGEYTLKVTTVVDANHVPVTKSTVVTVIKANSTIDLISPIGMVYGESGNVTVVTDGAAGIVAGLFDGETLIADAISVDGFVVTINGVGAGEYTLKVSTVVDANHNSVNATADVSVDKASINVSVSAVDVVYPGDVIVTVSAGVGGEYNLTVGAASEVISLEAGVVKEFAYAGLGAGTYIISVDCPESSNYTAVSVSDNVTVDKASINVSVGAVDVTYPGDVIAIITSDVAGTYTVTLGATSQSVVLEAGVAGEVKFANLAAGEYNITAVCGESENYTAAGATAKVSVGKADVNLTIKAGDVTYPGDVIVTLGASVGGTYSVTLGAASQSVVLEAGVAGEVKFANLAAGEYNITVSCGESENYTAASASANVAVDKASINVSVGAVDVVYPGVVVVTVSAGVGGEYNLTVGAASEVISLEAGVVKEFAYAGLGAGTYIISVDCPESSNYTAVSVSDNVTVDKASINVSVGAVDVTYPGDVIAIITSDVAGTYTVTLGATSQSVVLEAGSAKEFICSGLGAGTYNVTVDCPESSNYTAIVVSTNVRVAKAPITVNIVTYDVTYPGDVIVTVSVSVGGNYTVALGATSQSVVLEAGSVKEFIYSGLGTGTYNISVDCPESSNYAAVVQTASVTVNKVENTVIGVESTSPKAGENATVTVSLPGDATGDVTVKYGDKNYTAFVVNGTADVSVPTDVAGTNIASVTYSGDDNYAFTSKDVNITVKAKGIIIADDVRRGVNSSYDYLATLVDGDGNPVGGVEITFVINGQTYKAITNASGVVTVSAGLTVFNYGETVYDVIVTNPFTGENSTATTTIVPRLVVLSGDLSEGYLENQSFVVQAFGDDGLAVGAGEIVKFTLNGKTYSIATNESGIAVRTIGLAPGQYGVYAVYNGYKTQQVVFKVKKTISVKSGAIKKTANSFTFKATLKSTTGKSVAGKTVTFKFNGKKYTATTNAKGVAQYTIKSGVIKKLKVGTYKVSARYVNEVAKANIKVR